MNRNSQRDQCEQLVELLGRCGDEEPDVATLEQIETHVTYCAHCQETEALVRSTAARLQADQSEALSEEFEERLSQLYCQKRLRPDQNQS